MERKTTLSLNARPPMPKQLSKKEQMSTGAFKHFLAWRKTLIARINNGKLPLTKDDSDIKQVHFAINRQVALAVISDLEYNFRHTPDQVAEITGKSPVYWNFFDSWHHQ